MSRFVPLICALAFLILSMGCQKEENLQGISQVTYRSETGTILPELQWCEEITIQQQSVTLTRSGKVDGSEVNAGTWALPVDLQVVSALFEELEAVNLASIERIEPIDPPDGGGTDGYLIEYANGKNFSLDFNPGVIYSNGESITQPVQDFILTLQLPSDAVNHYK